MEGHIRGGRETIYYLLGADTLVTSLSNEAPTASGKKGGGGGGKECSGSTTATDRLQLLDALELLAINAETSPQQTNRMYFCTKGIRI